MYTYVTRYTCTGSSTAMEFPSYHSSSLEFRLKLKRVYIINIHVHRSVTQLQELKDASLSCEGSITTFLLTPRVDAYLRRTQLKCLWAGERGEGGFIVETKPYKSWQPERTLKARCERQNVTSCTVFKHSCCTISALGTVSRRSVWMIELFISNIGLVQYCPCS